MRGQITEILWPYEGENTHIEMTVEKMHVRAAAQ